MADSSLDDFFAKKDKSKKKTKSKITPGDVVPKQESDLKKGKKKKKDKQATSSSGENDPSNRTEKKEEDEEWVDFEQETEKDYSGLRIQNLQIGKEDEEEEENKENENDDDEDENGEKREIMSGPWNKSSSQPQSQQQTAPPPPPTPKEEEPPAPPPAEPAKTPGKYIPPSLRGGAGATPTEPLRPTPLRKKKLAPNLQSEEDFPTLGGGGGPGGEMSDMKGGPYFEKVQSGNRNAEDPKQQQSLTLGNKFSALQD